MKFTKLFKHLSERTLGEHTIGFEIEAIAINDPKYMSSDERRIENHMCHDYLLAQSPEGRFEFDGSVKTDVQINLDRVGDMAKNDPNAYQALPDSILDAIASYDEDTDDIPFEFISPVHNLTPETIQNLYKLVNELPSKGVYINESCGFHFHVAYPKITDTDMKWVITNLALNNDFIKKLSDFGSDAKVLFKEASPEYLYEIAEVLEDVEYDGLTEETFNKLNGLLDGAKKRLLRLHPQGTFEWRAPRGVLNEVGDLSVIKDVINQLIELVNFIRTSLKKRSIKLGQSVITRSQFDDAMDDGIFDVISGDNTKINPETKKVTHVQDPQEPEVDY